MSDASWSPIVRRLFAARIVRSTGNDDGESRSPFPKFGVSGPAFAGLSRGQPDYRSTYLQLKVATVARWSTYYVRIGTDDRDDALRHTPQLRAVEVLQIQFVHARELECLTLAS